MEKAQEVAVKIFAIHPNLEDVHITTDGQAFRKKADAEAHAQTLKDSKVYTFDREVAPSQEAKTEDDKEREALVEEYTKLFGKKPNHNIGTETLRKKIADEKARLEAEDTTDTGTDDTTTVQTDTGETVENKED